MLDLKKLYDGSLTYTITCNNCGKSYYTSYSNVPPYPAANMVCVNEKTYCAKCAKKLYDIDVKY